MKSKKYITGRNITCVTQFRKNERAGVNRRMGTRESNCMGWVQRILF